VPGSPQVTKYEPFDFIYASYKLNPDLEDLYVRVEGEDVYVGEGSKEVATRGSGASLGSPTPPKAGVTNRIRGGKEQGGSAAAANKGKDEYHNAGIFHKSVRIELLLAILQDKQSRGGADVNLPESVATGAIEAFFPVGACVWCQRSNRLGIRLSRDM